MAKLAALPLAFIITSSNVFVTPFTTIHPPRSGIKNHSFVPFTTTSYTHPTRSRGTRSFQDASQSSLGGKWDDLLDDEYETTNLPSIPRDMRYNEYNLIRQDKHFTAIRGVGGATMTNDVYARDYETNMFWFIGKIARISDVPLEQALARQYPLLVEHAARLRPNELYDRKDYLELWTAPGDSEMDVAYNRPHVKFLKMEDAQSVSGADEVKNAFVGFQGELYESGEEGFRTLRTEDGLPLKQEIQPDGEKRIPTEQEKKDINKVLEEKNLGSMFEE